MPRPPRPLNARYADAFAMTHLRPDPGDSCRERRRIDYGARCHTLDILTHEQKALLIGIANNRPSGNAPLLARTTSKRTLQEEEKPPGTG